MKPIETNYMGYRFRSRLEARWAVAFQHLKLDWRYEFEGFDLGPLLGWYLPDFYFPKDAGRRLFIEIKGSDPTPEERARMFSLTSNSHDENGIPVNGVILFGDMDVRGDCLWSWKDEAVTVERTGDRLSFLFDKPEWLIAEAITLGRSARFEHGETPRG